MITSKTDGLDCNGLECFLLFRCCVRSAHSTTVKNLKNVDSLQEKRADKNSSCY